MASYMTILTWAVYRLGETKPGKEVRVGDRLTLISGGSKNVLEILATAAKPIRKGAEDEYYRVDPPPPSG